MAIRFGKDARGRANRAPVSSYADFVDEALFRSFLGLLRLGKGALRRHGAFRHFPLALSPFFETHAGRLRASAVAPLLGRPTASKSARSAVGTGSCDAQTAYSLDLRAGAVTSRRGSACRSLPLSDHRAKRPRSRRDSATCSAPPPARWRGRGPNLTGAAARPIRGAQVGLVFANEVLDCPGRTTRSSLGAAGPPGVIFVVPRLELRRRADRAKVPGTAALADRRRRIAFARSCCPLARCRGARRVPAPLSSRPLRTGRRRIDEVGLSAVRAAGAQRRPALSARRAPVDRLRAEQIAPEGAGPGVRGPPRLRPLDLRCTGARRHLVSHRLRPVADSAAGRSRHRFFGRESAARRPDPLDAPRSI